MSRQREGVWTTTNADAESIGKCAEFAMRCDGMDAVRRSVASEPIAASIQTRECLRQWSG
jgi:hypothetical protein